MTAFALALVLVAAALHASWNYCAKRAGGGLPFVWLVGVVICTVYVPVVAAFASWKPVVLSWGAAAWIFGSGGLKTGYSLFLQRAYRSGDFSLVYPLARGTGPLLSTLAAIAILGERPSLLAIAGGLVIVGAVFILADGGAILGMMGGRKGNRVEIPVADAARIQGAVSNGVLCGVFIAAYTLWDRHGVHGLAIAPIIYDAGTSFTQLGLLTPFAARRWPEVVRHWREHRRYVWGVALLSPAAYVLVLTAMSFTPVSYVAPAREVSIVMGAFIGARYLRETGGRRRLWAALAMSAGVIALALG